MQKNKISSIVFASLSILLILTALLLNYEKNCGEDMSCFNQAFSSCTKARVIAYENENKFEYRILENKDNFCTVYIKILEVNPEATEKTKQQFKDKDMVCKFPEGQEFTTDKLNLCTGQLKETIYELTIQKMYNLLAQSLGEIISQMKE